MIVVFVSLRAECYFVQDFLIVISKEFNLLIHELLQFVYCHIKHICRQIIFDNNMITIEILWCPQAILDVCDRKTWKIKAFI